MNERRGTEGEMSPCTCLHVPEVAKFDQCWTLVDGLNALKKKRESGFSCEDFSIGYILEGNTRFQ